MSPLRGRGWPRGRRLVHFGILGVLVALLVAAVALPLFAGSGPEAARNAAFSEGETGHLALVGLAERQGATARTLLTASYLLEDVAEPTRTLVLVTRLDRDLGDGEVDALVAHVSRGGTLVVASHDARASAIAARFGVEHDGNPVLAVTGAAPVVTSSEGDTLRLASLTALHVSPDASGGATVLLRTSAQTFLDLNRDGRIDGFDRDGPFVAGVEMDAPHEGRAVFFGSSALFENAALDDDATRAFVEALLADHLEAGGTLVLFEGARTHPAQTVATGYWLLETATRHPWIKPLVVVALPLAAVLVAWRHPGPPRLEHVYRGETERHREIEKARLAEGLRELVVERARERAGLTAVEFDRLSSADRKAFIEATIASLLSGSPTEARAFASLHLFEED